MQGLDSLRENQFDLAVESTGGTEVQSDKDWDWHRGIMSKTHGESE